MTETSVGVMLSLTVTNLVRSSVFIAVMDFWTVEEKHGDGN